MDGTYLLSQCLHELQRLDLTLHLFSLRVGHRCSRQVWCEENPRFPYCHTDWVRDVAWRPDHSSVLATGSWDGTVVIWSQEMEGQAWRQLCKLELEGKVECLSWRPGLAERCGSRWAVGGS